MTEDGSRNREVGKEAKVGREEDAIRNERIVEVVKYQAIFHHLLFIFNPNPNPHNP